MCDVDQIPSELFMNILSRLPAERLLRLKCVCKSWLRMIDDPYFIKIHLDRQILKIHSGVGGHLFLLNRDKQFRSFSFDDDDHLLNSEFEIAHDINLNPLWETPMRIAPCNGLMLLCTHQQGHLWSIWNPLTREVHNLPYDDCEEEKVQILPTSHDHSFPIIIGGFGYDCVADDYKVLKVRRYYYLDGRIYESYTFLYSLKSNSWKRIKDFPSLIISTIHSGVFLNGALHYVVFRFHDDHDIYSVIAFNLETEDYQTYKVPFSMDDESEIVLGELGGCLSLSRHKYGKCSEWWLMNDYGIQNSWTLLFSITQTAELGYWKLEGMSYSKSKRLVLLKKNWREFFWYDLENKTAKNIRISGRWNDLYHSQVSTTSLVRINEGKRNEGKRKRKARG